MFSCKFCEFFQNIFFEEHQRTAASQKRGEQMSNCIENLICQLLFEGYEITNNKKISIQINSDQKLLPDYF